MDIAQLCAFVRQHRYAVVSSAANDGSPQSALVGVACTSSLELVFDTLRSTRKYLNLTQRPRCSAVIAWSGEQTLQLEGVADEPRGAALVRIQQLYFEQWPECRSHLQWPGMAWLVIQPTWMRYSDYDQHPPHIREARLDNGRLSTPRFQGVLSG